MVGPGGLHASFGRDAADAEWFYGFRLAVRTDLASRLIRAWGIVPAAVNERVVADGLLADAPPAGLLLDRGFIGRAWTTAHASAAPRSWSPTAGPSGGACRPARAGR